MITNIAKKNKQTKNQSLTELQPGNLISKNKTKTKPTSR
jgi:hypothetical protein